MRYPLRNSTMTNGIVLCSGSKVMPGSTRAMSLYEALGFRETRKYVELEMKENRNLLVR